MAQTHAYYTNCTDKFNLITEKLLLLTKQKNDESLINDYLCILVDLDYRYITISNNHVIQLLIKQLCTIVNPAQTTLVQNLCKLLTSLIQHNVTFEEQVYNYFKQWLTEISTSTLEVAHSDLFLTLRHILIAEKFHDVKHYMHLLLGNKRLLQKYLNASNQNGWSELHYNAVYCLEAILIRVCNGATIEEEYLRIIKNIAVHMLYDMHLSESKVYGTKILVKCLRILHIMTANNLLPHSIDSVGEMLGIIQAFLFYGIKGYLSIKPQLLRPAVMNLPEQVHTVPKCKNLKNQKAKLKKQTPKKFTAKEQSMLPESKNIGIYSSDSDTSDTESNNSVMDSKVRLEAVHLLRALIEKSQAKEIFGFWPQIVATGTRNDARVLTRCILHEPASNVKQSMLSALSELLIVAKPFLMHAEEIRQTSFITFFGTVCLMIKELHFTLSLILSGETNVAVLTHGLKCAIALIQGTPYSRLKTGLATKLLRNCRPYILHKDTTIQVSALAAFEALASCEPTTFEILEILAKQSTVNLKSPQLFLNVSNSDNTETEEEEEEVDVADLEYSLSNDCNNKLIQNSNVNFLIQISLENISNPAISTPVRFQSLKLVGRMAFNVGELVFSHTELVTTTLAGVLQEPDTRVILHACRTLEIMATCFINSEPGNDSSSIFWSIIFNPVTSLLQHSFTSIRKAACDCLGTINASAFSQLQREKVVLIITALFGAVHDKESAVRAAGLRALGMLVTLPSLKEETGFLMDLADIVCITADDDNLGVRIKGAWALANLCNCLFAEKEHSEAEPLPLELLLPKIYQVSIKTSKDNDKVKCNGVRALGSTLCACSNKDIINDTSLGLEVLINCSMTGNDMKVRWNACHALGLVLSNNPDDILPPSWRDQVFPALCSLICDSPNFKVRTNAAWALYSCKSYGKYTITLWKSIILAFENSQHVPSYVEYSHREALIEQLCLTLSRVAASTEVSDLQNLWMEISEHIDDISDYVKQFQETALPEKMKDLIIGKLQLDKYTKTALSTDERRIAQALANIFERTKRYDNLEYDVFKE